MTSPRANSVLDQDLDSEDQQTAKRSRAAAIAQAEAEMSVPVGEEEGWQIAKASFAREALHYSIQGGIALLILSGLVLGAFWLIHKAQHLPPHVVNGAKQMIDPVLKANPFNSPADNAPVPVPAPVVAPKKVASSAAASHRPKVKRARRQNSNRPGHGHVRPVQAGDDPTGGRVTYSDGMITEYSWK